MLIFQLLPLKKISRSGQISLFSRWPPSAYLTVIIIKCHNRHYLITNESIFMIVVYISCIFYVVWNAMVNWKHQVHSRLVCSKVTWGSQCHTRSCEYKYCDPSTSSLSDTKSEYVTSSRTVMLTGHWGGGGCIWGTVRYKSAYFQNVRHNASFTVLSGIIVIFRWPMSRSLWLCCQCYIFWGCWIV